MKNIMKSSTEDSCQLSLSLQMSDVLKRRILKADCDIYIGRKQLRDPGFKVSWCLRSTYEKIK